ncbi:MAG: histidine--tRNA ligase, partial [Methylococcus sp.]
DLKPIIDAAPVLADELDPASREHFASLRERLDSAGVAYVVNPRLVRGLDYYSRTVFEWVTDALGAQGTVCAGGRYDGLVEQLGGKDSTAVGFALGMERLTDLLDAPERFDAAAAPHAYLIAVGELAETKAASAAERLRDALPELRLQTNCGGGSFKSQFKRADKSGAAVALILGDDEARDQTLSVKTLRHDEGQRTLTESETIALLKTLP